MSLTLQALRRGCVVSGSYVELMTLPFPIFILVAAGGDHADYGWFG
jgi:hypothetical protein